MVGILSSLSPNEDRTRDAYLTDQATARRSVLARGFIRGRHRSDGDLASPLMAREPIPKVRAVVDELKVSLVAPQLLCRQR